jgi:xanthine dehydrogenase accessory factor
MQYASSAGVRLTLNPRNYFGVDGDTAMNSEFLEHVKRIHSGGDPVIMVLVVSAQPGSPQVPGARMLVSRMGRLYGTVGGGAIEKLAEEHAVALLNDDVRTDFKTYDLGSSQCSDTKTGMICGGRLSLYFEQISQPDRVIVYGCGHIGGILIPLAVQCGFHVIGVDDRGDMTDPARFIVTAGGNLTLLGTKPEEHARTLTVRNSDSIVIMTHAHRFDQDVLKALTDRLSAEKLPRYLGMIGSEKKNRTIFDRLRNEGVSQSILNAVRAPIGLSTGGDSPSEIAVSIMAEILAVKYLKLKNGNVASMSRK